MAVHRLGHESRLDCVKERPEIQSSATGCGWDWFDLWLPWPRWRRYSL